MRPVSYSFSTPMWCNETSWRGQLPVSILDIGRVRGSGQKRRLLRQLPAFENYSYQSVNKAPNSVPVQRWARENAALFSPNIN